MYILILVLSDADSDLLYAIYNQQKKRLLYVAKSYVGNQAEDLVHDVFLSLAEKYENKIEKLCDKKGYFFVTIVKNRAIDILRKDGLVEVIHIDEDSPVFADRKEGPVQQLVGREDLARLAVYLEQLKPKYRQILEYKYVLEYSNNDIAQALGITPSLVSTQIKRALNQLKEKFEKEEGKDEGL